MYNIEYAALNYYNSPVSDECLCVGVLFHNITTGQRDFKYISNFQRFHAFDDEADINFVKLYLRGIGDEIERSIINYTQKFDLNEYVKVYANEFRFSVPKKLNVDEDEDYVENIAKLFLRYDLPKSKRLNEKTEKSIIRKLLKSHQIDFSAKKVIGLYNDEIQFDYQVADLCVKILSYKGNNLKRRIGNAKQWSFSAEEVGKNKTVLFIYDADYEDKDNLNIIINILSKNENVKVLPLEQGIDYILERSQDYSLFSYADDEIFNS